MRMSFFSSKGNVLLVSVIVVLELFGLNDSFAQGSFDLEKFEGKLTSRFFNKGDLLINSGMSDYNGYFNNEDLNFQLKDLYNDSLSEEDTRRSIDFFQSVANPKFISNHLLSSIRLDTIETRFFSPNNTRLIQGFSSPLILAGGKYIVFILEIIHQFHDHQGECYGAQRYYQMYICKKTFYGWRYRNIWSEDMGQRCTVSPLNAAIIKPE